MNVRIKQTLVMIILIGQIPPLGDLERRSQNSRICFKVTVKTSYTYSW
jgi:hypothetical protein